MRRRRGYSLVDSMVAVALLGCGLLPLLELARANVASVRPRETEEVIGRFLASSLERLGGAPRRPDPLRAQILKDGMFRGDRLPLLARTVLGAEPEYLIQMFQNTELTVKITLVERAGDLEGLENWVAQATWQECGKKYERTRFRLVAR